MVLGIFTLYLLKGDYESNIPNSKRGESSSGSCNYLLPV